MIQLCIIQGCRIQGRHLPGCDDETCKGCLPRLAEDGYCCTRCSSLAAQNLASVAEVALAVTDAANRLSAGSGGGGPGKPGSQLPLNLGARSRLDRVTASLGGWARHVAEERGVRMPEEPRPPVPPMGPLCPTRYECTHGSCKAMRDPELPPPMLAVVARWLVGHLSWLAHRPEVDEVFADLGACARVLSGVVRGPAPQRFLGPCGAVRVDVMPVPDGAGSWDLTESPVGEPCDGDIYAREGASVGRCRTCGAEVSTDARRAWLDDEVRSYAFRAAHIAEAYGVRANTIRVWATRGLLPSYWRTEAGLVTPWIDPPLDPKLKGEEMEARLGEIADEIRARGGRLHYVGDVLDLASSEAARRAEAQAKRARRKENAA